MSTFEIAKATANLQRRSGPVLITAILTASACRGDPLQRPEFPPAAKPIPQVASELQQLPME